MLVHTYGHDLHTLFGEKCGGCAKSLVSVLQNDTETITENLDSNLRLSACVSMHTVIAAIPCRYYA